MPRGGKRPGAGRPKGGKNRPRRLVPATKSTTEAGDDESTPLDFMLKVMRDPTADEKTRLEAAKAAAPFVHRKADQGKKANAEEEARRVATGQGHQDAGWGDDLLDLTIRDRMTKQ